MITRAHQISFIRTVKERLTETKEATAYPDIYLSYLIDHLAYFVKIYAAVLNKGLQLAQTEMHQCRLADLGAGNGMLGIFAKYCGFKEVYLNDIDTSFIAASQKLATQLAISPTDFIAGDIHAVHAFFQKRNPPDMIVGTDMIEHIYDLPSFFDILFSMPDIKAVVFTTASNPANPLKVRQLRKIQYNDEYIGGTPGSYLLYGGDPMKPFAEIRRKIIQQSEKIEEPVLSDLVRRTRGMKRSDIEHAVSAYLSGGMLPPVPEDAYNTCNPISGSWSERILPISYYRHVFISRGYQFKTEPGFYNAEENNIKSRMMAVVNRLIPVAGISIAPFIFLSGSKRYH